MKSHIVGSTNAAPSTSANRFICPVANDAIAWATAITGIEIIAPHDMTLDQLRVVLNNAPTAGRSRAITVTINGTDSALTCTVADAATTAQDLSHSVAVSAGDRIGIKTVPTGTPSAPGTTWWTIRCDAPNLFAVFGLNAGPPTGSTNYLAPQNQTNISSTNDLGKIIMPVAGVFKNLRLRSLDQAPGSGKSWQFTLVKNGSDDALTATISDTSQNASDLSNTVSVAVADLVSLKVLPTGTPGASAIAYSMSFDPTVDGQSFVAYSGNGVGPSVSATNYNQVHGDNFTWNATETNRMSRLPACTIVSMYNHTSVSPGVSPKAYAFTARVEIADTAAAVTINDASSSEGSARYGGIGSQSIAVADDNRVTVKSVPASTPGSLFVKTSLGLYIAPPTTSAVFPSQSRRNILLRR